MQNYSFFKKENAELNTTPDTSTSKKNATKSTISCAETSILHPIIFLRPPLSASFPAQPHEFA
jgi:hypothetical protein